MHSQERMRVWKHCCVPNQIGSKHLKFNLKRWNSEIFGNIFKVQHDLTKELAELQQKISTGGHTEENLEQEQCIDSHMEERTK